MRISLVHTDGIKIICVKISIDFRQVLLLSPPQFGGSYQKTVVAHMTVR